MAAERPHGILKQSPEDFVVEELPAYTPSGEGTHVYVRFTKTDRTTLDAVRAIARALGCDPRDAGFAGMKDRRAVTTQTISLQPPRGVDPRALAARAAAGGLPGLDGIAVHDASLHGNKLKPGHLAGNRFTIVVRGVPREALDAVEAGLARVATEGVPNAFGAQRFGRQGDNARRALAWLRGEERGPSDRRVQRLLWSALQSAVFNAVLDARVAGGTFATPLAGDLLKLRTSGGLFVCADVQTDEGRARAGDLSPTGPIIGGSMRWPEGAPLALERRIAASILGEGFDLEQTRRLGEGSRRALRVWAQDVRWENVEDDSGHGDACIRVYFVLPKGAYATTVLASVFHLPGEGATESESEDS
ncbi:MAG TPA: tRNA pseudouridine(13) synthase TruD [Polyangiaceae bacterium]|jgi:tRNA pseudouridine13 synthase